MLNRLPFCCGVLLFIVFLFPALRRPVFLKTSADFPGEYPADSLVPTQAYAVICSDEIYIWNNFLLSTAGIFRDTFRAYNGLDSIVELHLSVLPSNRSDQYATMCPDVPLLWGGHTFLESGVYCDTFVTISGCDSVVCFHVSMLDRQPVTMIGAALCPGTTYNWNGRDYSVPGLYVRNFASANGCDSLVQLRIEVLDSIPVTYVDSLIESAYSPGAPVHPGIPLQEFRDTFPSRLGCDSIVVTRVRHDSGK